MMDRLQAINLNDSVTLHMRKDFASVQRIKPSVKRWKPFAERPRKGGIIYFYVVDQDRRLQGVLPTRRLLLNPPEMPVAEIMIRHVIACRRRPR